MKSTEAPPRDPRWWMPVLVLAILVPWPGFGQDADADIVLERAAARYQAMDGFCAEFRQEMDVTVLRQVTRSRGELCQANSDLFEMRFTDPDGDRVVADGSHLWVYFPSTDDGQVLRRQLGDAERHFDLHGEFLSAERYSAALEGHDTFDGRDTYVLALQPRGPSPYVSARVWVDRRDHLIRKLVIHEDSESIRTLELYNIRLDPAFAEGTFQFDPPAGVQVINR